MAENGNTVTVTDDNFSTEIEGNDGLAIVDFWAAWCGPCRMVAPIVEQIASDYEGKVKVGKLDVDATSDGGALQRPLHPEHPLLQGRQARRHGRRRGAEAGAGAEDPGAHLVTRRAHRTPRSHHGSGGALHSAAPRYGWRRRNTVRRGYNTVRKRMSAARGGAGSGVAIGDEPRRTGPSARVFTAGAAAAGRRLATCKERVASPPFHPRPGDLLGPMLYIVRRRALLLLAAGALAPVAPAAAQLGSWQETTAPDLGATETLKLQAASGVADLQLTLSVYVGPYSAFLTSDPTKTTFTVYCVDFLNSITVGSVWTANVTNVVTGALATTRLGLMGVSDALVRYQRATGSRRSSAWCRPAPTLGMARISTRPSGPSSTRGTGW